MRKKSVLLLHVHVQSHTNAFYRITNQTIHHTFSTAYVKVIANLNKQGGWKCEKLSMKE